MLRRYPVYGWRERRVPTHSARRFDAWCKKNRAIDLHIPARVARKNAEDQAYFLRVERGD